MGLCVHNVCVCVCVCVCVINGPGDLRRFHSVLRGHGSCEPILYILLYIHIIYIYNIGCIYWLHIYIYTHTHTHTHTHTYIQRSTGQVVCINMYTRVKIYTCYIYTHTHIHINSYTKHVPARLGRHRLRGRNADSPCVGSWIEEDEEEEEEEEEKEGVFNA